MSPRGWIFGDPLTIYVDICGFELSIVMEFGTYVHVSHKINALVYDQTPAPCALCLVLISKY